MKKLFIYLFILSGFSCFAQDETIAWDYPVKPGTEEWKSFKSRPEMVDACQVPGSILKIIDTKSLAELCFNYPLIHDINAFNILQKGFDHVTDDFNGFTELFQRQDVGKVLLERYMAINAMKVKDIQTSFQKGLYIANLSLLELFLSQNRVIIKLSKEEKYKLIEEASSKFKSKKQYAKNYGLWGMRTTPLLMGRIMRFDKYQEFDNLISDNNTVAASLETGSLYDFDVMEEIVNKAQDYLNFK